MPTRLLVGYRSGGSFAPCLRVFIAPKTPMSQPARRNVGIPFAAGNPGRPPGPNRVTVSVKAALEAAFLGLGGVPALIAWGQQEPGEFYRLWGKLLPRNVTIEGGAQLGIVILPPLGSATATAHASISPAEAVEAVEATVEPAPALAPSSVTVGDTVDTVGDTVPEL